MQLFLGGNLDFYAPNRQSQLEVTLPQPTRLVELLGRLGIPPGEVHLVIVNGESVDPDTAVLTDEDQVKLFSAVGGG